MFCTKCGKTVAESSSFCNHCGAPQGQTTVDAGNTQETKKSNTLRTTLIVIAIVLAVFLIDKYIITPLLFG